MKKQLLLAALLSGLCFTASAKTVTFGMEGTYAPFEFFDDKNELVGFDVDIAKKVCEVAQTDCKFRNQAYDSLIPSLKTRRIDAIISGMDITAERQEQVDFTQPYYENSAEFIALKGKITDIAQLNGKRVGVQNGTTHQQYLMQKHPDITVVNYDSYQYAVLDLASGRIDAIFSDSAVGNVWLKKDAKLAVIGKPVTDPQFFGTGLGIAVRKGNAELLQKFDQALKQIKADGSYQQIHDKWFK